MADRVPTVTLEPLRHLHAVHSAGALQGLDGNANEGTTGEGLRNLGALPCLDLDDGRLARYHEFDRGWTILLDFDRCHGVGIGDRVHAGRAQPDR
jgi:hypothetical protein